MNPEWRCPRVRAVRPELPQAAELQGQVPGADDRHPLLRWPGLDQPADGLAQLHEPPGLRGQVESGVDALPEEIRRQVLVPLQEHPGQPESAFLVVEVSRRRTAPCG